MIHHHDDKLDQRNTSTGLRFGASLLLTAIVATGWGALNSPTFADELDIIADMVSVDQYTVYLRDELYTHDGDDRKYGPEHDLARDFIQAEMERLGLDVSLHPFQYSGNTYYNVVGVQTGTVYPEQIYILGAHYDSVGNPGADDNASGTAGVLEAARVLSQLEFESTIIYIAFDREEQGLHGSDAYAEDHENDDIRGMLNLDMIAYVPDGPDRGLIYGRSASNPLKDGFIAALADYGPITAYDDGAADFSDHAPFEWRGFQAAMLIEYDYGSNPHYHRQSDSVDTPGYIDYEYATLMTRGTAAYLAQLAGLTGLVLAEPAPGHAGMTNTLTTDGATPFERTYFVYGSTDGLTEVPPCPGVYVEINSPIIAGSAVADADDEASIDRYVPGAASGRTYYIQSVEPETCRVSNLVVYTFP